MKRARDSDEYVIIIVACCVYARSSAPLVFRICAIHAVRLKSLASPYELGPLSYSVNLRVILISRGESACRRAASKPQGKPGVLFHTWCLPPLPSPPCIVGAECKRVHGGRGAAASRGPSGYYAHEGSSPSQVPAPSVGAARRRRMAEICSSPFTAGGRLRSGWVCWTSTRPCFMFCYCCCCWFRPVSWSDQRTAPSPYLRMCPACYLCSHVRESVCFPSRLSVISANFSFFFFFRETKVASIPAASLRELLHLMSCLPSLRYRLCNVLCDLGENDPVADCYMVGAQ